ncbi:hypothetical protein SACT1_0131 [Streptomyces sp. ACT-1]|nr:hypothetical protein SACT1_0131 [Streptomyces sp. ACT-1]
MSPHTTEVWANVLTASLTTTAGRHRDPERRTGALSVSGTGGLCIGGQGAGDPHVPDDGTCR